MRFRNFLSPYSELSLPHPNPLSPFQLPVSINTHPMLRKFIMNTPVLQTLKLTLGSFGNYENKPGKFVPYFQYEIGPYQEGFKLYFPEMPRATRYYNTIFLTLVNYQAHDATRFMEYHYNEYPDKEKFLRFLKEELKFRLAQCEPGAQTNYVVICTISLEWIEEKLTGLQTPSPSAPPPLPLPVNIPSFDQFGSQLCNNLDSKIAGIMEKAESKIMHLVGQYESGNIEIANLHMKEKLIILLLCLKNLCAKPARKNKPGDPLFTKMELNDIAQILHLHFAPYKGLKIDTIEKRIYEVNNNLKTNEAHYEELYKALQKFFFT